MVPAIVGTVIAKDLVSVTDPAAAINVTDSGELRLLKV